MFKSFKKFKRSILEAIAVLTFTTIVAVMSFSFIGLIVLVFSLLGYIFGPNIMILILFVFLTSCFLDFAHDDSDTEEDYFNLTKEIKGLFNWIRKE